MNPTEETNSIVGLSARLGFPQGDCYVRGYTYLPLWILTSLGIGVLALGAWALVRNRLGAFRVWGAGRVSAWRDVLGLASLCVLLVAAFDGSGFIHGFFRQDDFSFLQVAQETSGLGRQLLLYHNDHLYPLYRLEVWVLVKVAGSNASAHALAACFNATNFITCVGLLLSSCWVLHELGGSRLALCSLAYLAWIWPGWGEFTAGFYTLSAYLQVQTLGFCATAAMVRGLGRDSIGWLVGSLVLLAAAIAVDVSGAAAFGCVFVLGAAWRHRERLRFRIPYLLALSAVFLAVCAASLLVRHPYSSRELVQNPGGQPAGLSLVGNLLHHPVGMMRASVSSLGGLLLNLFTPTFLQYIAPKVSVIPVLRDGLILVELLVVALAARFADRRLRQLSATDRSIIMAFIGCAGVCLGLVIVARTSYALQVPATFWHAKYIVMPACWIWVGSALLADRLWLSACRPCPRSSGGLMAAFAIGIWLNLSCYQWERTLIPGTLAYTARGRWGNVSNAEARFEHYQSVMADLEDIARFSGTNTVTLPEPSGWSDQFYRLHSELEWGSDYTPIGVTNLFWDMLAASPGLHLHGKWAPYTTFTPALQRHFERFAWLRHPRASSPSPAGAPEAPPRRPRTSSRVPSD
jgi:hypothetical protein